MALLLIPFIILVVIVQGVRVIRGHYPVSDPRRDETSIRKWQEANARGFLRHCLRSGGPFVAGYYILAPLAKATWQAGHLAFPFQQLPYYIVFAAITILAIGSLDWKMLDSAAYEAQQRLQAARS